MGIRIFIVEDHLVIRQLYRQLIERVAEQNICGEASRGAEALDILATTQPDLVLLDVGLPDMNGIEVLRNLLEQNPAQVVLVISGQDEDLFYAKQALQAGARGYLDKLGLAQNLQTAIQQICAGRRFVSQEVQERIVRSDPTFEAYLSDLT